MGDTKKKTKKGSTAVSKKRTSPNRQGAKPVKRADELSARYDLRILQSLRRIVRCIEIHSRHLATSFDITGPQLISLLALRDTEPLTATMLSQKIHVSPSTVVGILDRLEDKALISRERSSEDRRVVYVRLTKKGKTLITKAPSPLQDKLHQALHALPELERSTIALALERIVQMMEAEEVDDVPIVESGRLEVSAEAKALVSKIEEIS